ncbi:MAG TPA: YncE family protein, partial [Nitrososphaeraceae archaeon]
MNLNSNTNMVYVASANSNTVAVIDGQTNKAIINSTAYSGDQSLDDAAVDQNTNMLFLSRADYYKIAEINGLGKFDRFGLKTDVKKIVTNFTVGNAPLNSSGNNPFPLHVAVNPSTNMVYVPNYILDTIFVIDDETNKIVAEITGTSFPVRVAINSDTNMVYVLSTMTDTVYVVNGQTNKIISKVKVGDFPWSLTVNPNTNIVYVTNRDSNTISVIDGNTNKLVVGVSLNVNPLNSGVIFCNGKKTLSNYKRFGIEAPAECEARTNPGFAFSSWSGDLVSDSASTVQFTPSQFGKKLNANFIVPIEVTLPKE